MNMYRNLIVNPYRYTYLLARRDGMTPSWARHLWWRDILALMRGRLAQ